VQRHVDVVFFDPDAPAPVVSCGHGSGACKTRDCELYDPREYDLAYVPLDATIPVGGLIDFFVFRDDQDSEDAGVDIACAWEDQLALGWVVQGEVSRLLVRNEALGAAVDVLPLSRRRADGTLMGRVPLVVPRHAAARDVATYRLHVERPGGEVPFEPRVRVALAGHAPKTPAGFFVPLFGAEHAHHMGFGRMVPRRPWQMPGAA
jgi:hypothetical protein